MTLASRIRRLQAGRPSPAAEASRRDLQLMEALMEELSAEELRTVIDQVHAVREWEQRGSIPPRPVVPLYDEVIAAWIARGGGRGIA